MNKKLLYSVIAIAAVLGGWVIFVSVKTYELGGGVSSIEGDYAIISGFLDPAQLSDSRAPAEPDNIKVRLSAGTKFTKIVIRIPATGEMVRISDLPKEESEVGIDQFRQDVAQAESVIGFKAEAKRNLINPFVFRAAEVEYRVPIFESRE